MTEAARHRRRRGGSAEPPPAGFPTLATDPEALQRQLLVFTRDITEIYRREKSRAEELEVALNELKAAYLETIRSLGVPHLHEVGLRDRFVPEGENAIKTTLGMWYQAFDRSLTQDEIASHHHQLATRLAAMLPVKLL